MIEKLQDIHTRVISTGDLAPKLLSYEQAKKFVDLVFDKSLLLKQVKREIVTGQTKQLAYMNLSGNVWVAVDEYELISHEQKPTFSYVEISPRTLAGKIIITDEVAKQTIAGGNFEDYVIEMATTAAQNNWEKLLILGDVNSSDDLLRRCDGVIRQLEKAGRYIDFKGEILSPKVFRAIEDGIEDDFLTEGHKFYMNRKLYNMWHDYLIGRGTEQADTLLVTGRVLPALGYDVVKQAYMPVDDKVGKILFINPTSIISAIAEEITVEAKRVPERRATEYYFHAQIDVKVPLTQSGFVGINVAFA